MRFPKGLQVLITEPDRSRLETDKILNPPVRHSNGRKVMCLVPGTEKPLRVAWMESRVLRYLYLVAPAVSEGGDRPIGEHGDEHLAIVNTLFNGFLDQLEKSASSIAFSSRTSAHSCSCFRCCTLNIVVTY